MSQFGMLQQHKDALRRNRVLFIQEMNVEPVLQRLRQFNVISQNNLESLQAPPTRDEKNEHLLDMLPKRGPKAFQAFCRALSSTGQQHLRNTIQPEGVNWSISLRSVLTYNGQTLALHKVNRFICIPYTGWKKLLQHVPEIQVHLDKQSEVKLLLHGDLYVITSRFQDHMYVGLHQFAGAQIIRGSGFNITMDEWTDILTVMDSVSEEVEQSQPQDQFSTHELIHMCYMYILERDILGRAQMECFGCQHDSPGQRDHMDGGCLAEWQEKVERFLPESLLNMSRPLFAEVCR